MVPIRLSREQVRKINLLVKLGIYSNRSEAIKSMVEHSIDLEVQRYLANPRVEQALKALLTYKGDQDPVKLTTKKAAAELVAEGRL